MVLQAIIALAALSSFFILFLVLSKTLNSIVNHLTKVEFLLRRDLELKQKELEIKREILAKAERERRRLLEEDEYGEQ